MEGEIVLVADGDERLDRFLARRLGGYSRSRLAEWIEAGGVLVDGRPRKPAFRLAPGMQVRLEPPPERPAHDLTPVERPLEVLYEDDQLLVVNKPRGMATHPAPSLREPSLVNVLLARGSALSGGSAPYRPGIVHRLDKDTTGLLVVAKTDRCHRLLAQQIADKSAERRYLAWVHGRPPRDSLRIEQPIGRDPRNRTRMAVTAAGKPAATVIKVLACSAEGRTLVGCRLETGRTHQIRVHLSALGHPVVGDAVYGRRQDRVPLQLHAGLLALHHPDGRRMEWTCEPPADFLSWEGSVKDLLAW
ncbi:MAG: RluA family pseudouridine synthase [Fimbriimonadales bacterium]|nr:RluA family pseudouridine synthase [Fimbriimonadales bacterium]